MPNSKDDKETVSFRRDRSKMEHLRQVARERSLSQREHVTVTALINAALDKVYPVKINRGGK